MPPKTNELRICIKQGVHTCRLGSIHLNEREKPILEDYIATKDQEKEAAIKAERERCLKALPDEYIIHDYMPSENTPARRGWNDYRLAAITALTSQESSK